MLNSQWTGSSSSDDPASTYFWNIKASFYSQFASQMLLKAVSIQQHGTSPVYRLCCYILCWVVNIILNVFSVQTREICGFIKLRVRFICSERRTWIKLICEHFCWVTCDMFPRYIHTSSTLTSLNVEAARHQSCELCVNADWHAQMLFLKAENPLTSAADLLMNSEAFDGEEMRSCLLILSLPPSGFRWCHEYCTASWLALSLHLFHLQGRIIGERQGRVLIHSFLGSVQNNSGIVLCFYPKRDPVQNFRVRSGSFPLPRFSPGIRPLHTLLIYFLFAQLIMSLKITDMMNH